MVGFLLHHDGKIIVVGTSDSGEDNIEILMNHEKFSQGILFLSQAGLNLFAVLDCAALPQDVAQLMQTAGIPLDQFARLVLLGHGGQRLWEALAAFGHQTEDPVDDYSIQMTETFIKKFLDNPPVLMLYPTTYNIPLQRFGELAGWSHPSPVGIGINETYGLWFAYRTAFLTTLALPLTTAQATQSPCDSCQDKPCIGACPVEAVQPDTPFNVHQCANFRVEAESICQDRCLARLACPVAAHHRYSLKQIRYHYTRSLETIRLYYNPPQEEQ